jgi:hypothetical protein
MNLLWFSRFRMQNGAGDTIGLTTEQVNLLAAQGAVNFGQRN